MACLCSTRRLVVNTATLIVVTAALGGALGCSKKKQEGAKAQAEAAEIEKTKRPTGDRYADGQRLAAALKDWTRRWADTPELPACEPLLKQAPDLELCKAASAALTTMKTAAAKPESEAVLLRAAADLAIGTEAVSEKLRSASMEKLQTEQKTSPSASAAPGRTTPPGAASAGKPRPLGSAGKTALMEKSTALEASPLDPGMQVIQAYSRVNRASLRYLSQFLQFGALPTRKAAFTELEALSKRRPTWPALGRTLREAAMAENDADLQGRLKVLAPSLSRRAPTSLPGGTTLAPPGAPPGAPGNAEPSQGAPATTPAAPHAKD